MPAGCRVVGVGSAVLGGAGKTPLCIALARALAVRDGPTKVALIGHAYRGKPGCARIVRWGDAVRAVGDDALYAARALEGAGIAVVVAPNPIAAIRHAAEIGAETLIVDGLLRSPSSGALRSVMVLDGDRPWGGGSCPPLGDLRAHPDALLDAADVVACVGDAAGAAPDAVGPGEPRRPRVWVRASLDHAISADGTRVALATLPSPIGLVTSVAHPERIVRALERRSIPIANWLRLADHARAREATDQLRARPPMRVWLTPARSSFSLPSEVHGAPVLALDQRLDVAELLNHLDPSP